MARTEIMNRSRIADGFSTKSISKVCKCDYCGEKYNVRLDDVEYIVKLGKKRYYFCSWTHKCKFIREHEKEVEQEKKDNDKVELFERQTVLNRIRTKKNIQKKKELKEKEKNKAK